MKVMLLIILTIGITGCGDHKPILTSVGKAKELFAKVAEEAYYEGQKDFMERDIRIKKLDNGRQPSFHPPIKTQRANP